MELLNDEILPVVNENGDVIGSAPRARCHGGGMILHPVVHLHVFRDGKLLLQHRSKFKKIQPDKWDTAVGGHVAYNESISDALKREVEEEIGLREFNAVNVSRYIFRSDVEQEMVNTFISIVAPDFEPVATEQDIDSLAFFTIEEIQQMIEQGKTTPNFAQEFRSIIQPFVNGK